MVQEVNIPRLTRENQKVFINRAEISGVQSVQAQYEISSRVFKFIGMRESPIIAQGGQIGSFNVNAWLISSDPFIAYTGDIGFNGYILKDTGGISGNFSFTSGYLTNYSCRCSIGQIPEISAAATIFGNIGKLDYSENPTVSGDLVAIQTGVPELPLQITAPGTIDLTLDEFESNRVMSFEVSISSPRNPVYALGLSSPKSVNLNYPVEVICNFQFEVFKYEASNLKRFKCSPKVQDVSITLKTFDTEDEVLTFDFNDMTLISENYSENVDGNVVVAAKYKTCITRS